MLKTKISDVIVKSLCQGQTDINIPTSTNSRVMQVSNNFFYWSIQILCMKFTTNLTICWSVYFITALVLFTTEIKIVLPYNILMYYDVWYNIYNLQVYPTVSPHHFGTVICITVCMIIYTCIYVTLQPFPPETDAWMCPRESITQFPVICQLSSLSITISVHMKVI